MAGLDYILWGAVSLILATVITFTKTNFARRWLGQHREGSQFLGPAEEIPDTVEPSERVE